MLLRFFDELGMMLSDKRAVDGLPIFYDRDNGSVGIDRVVAALQLIKCVDPIRFKRLLRDLRRIWIATIPGPVGRFIESTSTCELDDRYVSGERTAIEEIAGTIVHEATHARLCCRGIGYEDELRMRVELVCMGRELAFGSRLEDGSRIRRLVDARQIAALDTSDIGLEAQQVAAAHSALLHLNAPRWLTAIVVTLAELRLERHGKRRSLRSRPASNLSYSPVARFACR